MSIHSISGANQGRGAGVAIGSLGIVVALALKALGCSTTSAYALGGLSASVLVGSAIGSAVPLGLAAVTAAVSAYALLVYFPAKMSACIGL